MNQEMFEQVGIFLIVCILLLFSLNTIISYRKNIGNEINIARKQLESLAFIKETIEEGGKLLSSIDENVKESEILDMSIMIFDWINGIYYFLNKNEIELGKFFEKSPKINPAKLRSADIKRLLVNRLNSLDMIYELILSPYKKP